jgi:hypothetical protein
MWFLLASLAGCALLDLVTDDSPPRDCAVRTPYYPDVNGDGIGEPTDVWLACSKPDGWVTSVGPGAPTTAPPAPTTDSGGSGGSDGSGGSGGSGAL